MNLSLSSSPLARPRFGRRILPRLAILVGGLCLLSRGWAAVEFTARQTAYLVTSPASVLEERVVGQLSDYVGRVLGQPARRVATLDEVPGGAPRDPADARGTRTLGGCAGAGRLAGGV